MFATTIPKSLMLEVETYRKDKHHNKSQMIIMAFEGFLHNGKPQLQLDPSIQKLQSKLDELAAKKKTTRAQEVAKLIQVLDTLIQQQKP
jgi:hypothetical protein